MDLDDRNPDDAFILDFLSQLKETATRRSSFDIIRYIIKDGMQRFDEMLDMTDRRGRSLSQRTGKSSASPTRAGKIKKNKKRGTNLSLYDLNLDQTKAGQEIKSQDIVSEKVQHVRLEPESNPPQNLDKHDKNEGNVDILHENSGVKNNYENVEPQLKSQVANDHDRNQSSKTVEIKNDVKTPASTIADDNRVFPNKDRVTQSTGESIQVPIDIASPGVFPAPGVEVEALSKRIEGRDGNTHHSSEIKKNASEEGGFDFSGIDFGQKSEGDDDGSGSTTEQSKPKLLSMW